MEPVVGRFTYDLRVHAVHSRNLAACQLHKHTESWRYTQIDSRIPSYVASMFKVMARASVPRNYHSTGLLLPDARVFNGGGGLNGPNCGYASSDAAAHHEPCS